MLFFVVFFPTDKEYIVVNESVLEFDDQKFSNFTINDWKAVTDEVVSGNCLYENEIHTCNVAFVATSESSATFVLKLVETHWSLLEPNETRRVDSSI